MASLERTPARPPAEQLAALLVRLIGHRPGLSNLNDAFEFGYLTEAMEETLRTVPLEEMGRLLRCVFEHHRDFWRDRISEAKYPGAMIRAHLKTLLAEFRADRTQVHHVPKLNFPFPVSGPVERY